MRVELLMEDLEKFIRAKRIRTILDIGAGHAPVTLLLLQRFPQLTAILVEPSGKLLREGSRLRRMLGIEENRARSVLGTLSTLRRQPETADLILCHAVANWTPRPMQFIDDLAVYTRRHVRYLSLVVGSSLAKAIRFATQGELRDARVSALFPGTSVGSLIGKAKVRPLHPDTVSHSLQRNGGKILFRTGIRVFSDYVPKNVLQTPKGYRTALRLERSVRQHPDWWRFGQLVHFFVGF